MATAAESSRLEIIDWNKVDLYRFFAYAFGPPSVERHEWFSQPGVNAALAELWKQLSCEGEFPGFEWFSIFEKYEATYIALFDVGIPEPPVPLFESAHDKSRPAQELILENTYFYDVFGLRVDPQLSVPDHLLTQLEFLSTVAYAHDNACDKFQALDMARLELDFLERHLMDWTNKAERKLRDCSIPSWDVLFSLMTCRLRQRHQQLKAQMTLPQP